MSAKLFPDPTEAPRPLTPPRENVKLIADQGGGGDPVADRYFPFLRERLGPGRRRLEAGRLGISIGAAPRIRSERGAWRASAGFPSARPEQFNVG